jgi:hypothetical protein
MDVNRHVEYPNCAGSIVPLPNHKSSTIFTIPQNEYLSNSLAN